MKINVTVEIPKNSKIKYEYDRKTKNIIVDRILYGSAPYPINYGFISKTLDWDGDELDAMIIADQEFMPGSIVPVRVLGAMEMIDNGETDTKLITVIDCDPRYNNILKIDDLNDHLLKEIQDFFINYKNLQEKKVLIKGFKSYEWAIKEYNICVELFNKYSNLEKNDFLTKMKKEHPEYYSK
ncbi:MAG: inorganic diphosphatase [Mycoplasmoidaceae bacterium]